MNGQEFPIGGRNSPKHEFPQQQNQHVDFHHYTNPGGTPPPPPPHNQNQDLTIDGIPNGGVPPGSNGAFPHRRSRASRTFKNPPQPHFCIREKTIDGKEVFINVLSWTRIANPDNPDAPIPLYGGMKVGKIPPGSPRAPPLVYAVMASPEVLKKAGRKCPDTPERMNLVDLMCEFVEAMNPTLHLSRKPEILKDRDLSGELKDVWSAVQACRDKGRVDSGPPENLVVYTEFGPETAPSYEQSQHQQQQFPHQHYQQPFGGDTFHQFQNHHHQQPQQQQQQQPQSAITDSSDANTSDQHPDVPDCGGPVNDHLHHHAALDELCQETDGLKIAGTAKSNGLTLPTTSTTTSSPSNSAESSPATSPLNNAAPVESNPVPANLATSPTSPTTTPTPAAVSPTPAAAPATPQKESKNSSHFFPMFRSSKSSSSSEKSADSSAVEHAAAADAAQPETTTTTTPVKSSSKKSSGLNFFRRNKTDSKKAEPSTTVPVTPTKQKQQQQSQEVNPQVGEKQLLDKLDESLMHHTHHHHHHHGGNNGTGEIIENSSATIVAK